MQVTSEAKHLEVMSDRGLTWWRMLDTAIRKAYRAFWECRSMFGRT
jgi:hypothetical protein